MAFDLPFLAEEPSSQAAVSRICIRGPLRIDPAQLELLGFNRPQRAAAELTTLATRVGQARIQELLERFRTSGPGSAERLLSRLERLGTTVDSASWTALIDALEASDFWPRILQQRPGLLRLLSGSRWIVQEKTLERFIHECAGATKTRPSPKPAMDTLRRLRRYKYRELWRLTALDLTHQAPMEVLGRQMSHLAEALIRSALGAAYVRTTDRHGVPANATHVDNAGLCVLGLGKLGGEDLNYSSDIDLIFVYRDDGTTSGGLPHIQFYAKWAEETAKLLSAVTPDGFCFRVDLNLRPQGRSGALVPSLPAMLSYYETRGRTWERAALIKARPLAGDLRLGEALLEGLSPFIWRRTHDLSSVEELRALKAQIDLRGQASVDDVKLGPGGIREIEFFVGALQLLHGGKDPALRERHTLRALRKLQQSGLVSAPDADALEEAYLFLRRVENRLQLVEESQTQALPNHDTERGRLALGLGYQDWDGFAQELGRHRQFVAQAFSTLLGQTARNTLPDEPLLAVALDLNATPEERMHALSTRGFCAPERALNALERLGRLPESPFAGMAAIHPQALRLLSEVVRTPDPDQALMHLSDFLSRLRSPLAYLSLLEQTPQATRRLINLFGQSDYLSAYFVRHPELLDALVQRQFDEPVKDSERIRRELTMRAHRYPTAEQRLGALRRFKNEELLRIGLNDISHELDVPQVGAQLSAIADGSVDELLFLAHAEMQERYGWPRSEGTTQALVVVGLGKLGGQELGYQSDLDLLFVYSGRGQDETTGGSRGVITHHEFFAKVVQRLLSFLQIQLLEGQLYAVDTRLRPSGNKGTLVVSQQAFKEHHEKRAQLWERQALVKARFVCGDASLWKTLEQSVLIPLVYERPLPDSAAADIDRLRMRMQNEASGESESQRNMKSGHGGIVDIEFAVQYLQLRHGGKQPSLRTPNTLEALEALRAAGLLSTQDAETLRQGYGFHRRLASRLRLIHGQPVSWMPTGGRPLALLARRLGYLGSDAGEALMSEYRVYASRVRDTYLRTLQPTLGD